jgi:phosphatidylserine/phosphatidylglycerophosphate/cardiolipin synthase-like enzyme
VIDEIRRLPLPTLRALARALEQGRLSVPCSATHLVGLVPEGREVQVAAALAAVTSTGAPAQSLAWTLHMLADERASVQAVSDCVDLVWSGPEAPGSINRDTGVVVAELFAQARTSVLIATFAVDGGEIARAIFGSLAARLDAGERLDVRLILNVHRKFGDDTPSEVLLRRFTSDFRSNIWPGRVMPQVFYDPRSLEQGAGGRACLHAKCVVIDDRVAFVTSANFTEAAQLRNVESGVLLRDEGFARSLAAQFTALIRHGDLVGLALGRA